MKADGTQFLPEVTQAHQAYQSNLQKAFGLKGWSPEAKASLKHEAIPPSLVAYYDLPRDTMTSFPQLSRLIAHDDNGRTIKIVEVSSNLIIIGSHQPNHGNEWVDFGIISWAIFDMKRGVYQESPIPETVIDELIKMPLLIMQPPQRVIPKICFDK